MYVLPLIIIALCKYTSTAGDDASKVVDLDVRTRKGTDRVKVGIKEDGNMIIYKIEPKGKCKVGKFVDENEVIYVPRDNEKNNYLEVRCLKSTDQPVIVSLCHSRGLFKSIISYNYFYFEDGWGIISDRFYNFLVEKMQTCKLINRRTVFNEYNQHIEEVDKQKVEVDLSKKDEVASGIIREDGSEDDIRTCTYTVDEKTIISKVVNGNVEIWERAGGEYGCYKFKVCYLPQDDKLIILAVKGPAGMNLIFCGKTSEGNYGQIKRENFNDQLKKADVDGIINEFLEFVDENTQLDDAKSPTTGSDDNVPRIVKNVDVDVNEQRVRKLEADVRRHGLAIGDDGKIIMSSFLNKQGIRIRTYASRVDNPKGHIIMIHGIRAHFRSVFCSYNLEWYEKYVGEYPNPDAQTLFERESKDIFPDLESLNKDGEVYEDLLHGKNILDVTPRFKYEESFLHLMNKLGYSAYGLDLQSHGLSGGICEQRSYVDKFDDFALELMQFTSIIKRGKFDDPSEVWDEHLVYSDDRHDGNRYYMLGISLGGNIAMKSQVLFSMNAKANMKYVDSMICLSTMLNLEYLYEGINRIIVPLVRLYSKISPKGTLIFESDRGYENGLDLCMRYNDPLYYSKRTPLKMIFICYDATIDLKSKMNHYPKDLPTLFIHSKDDQMCSINGPREYMDTFFKDSEIVKLHELDGKIHVITNPSDFPIMEHVLKRWFNTLYHRM